MALSAVPNSSYERKSFDKKKYEVTNYQYPSDLMGTQSSSEGKLSTNNQYGGNYVIFYINVNNESRMFKNPDGSNNEEIIVPIDASERVLKNIVGQEYGSKISGLVKSANNAVNQVTNDGATKAANAIKDFAGINISANGLGDAINSTFSRPQKRLKTAIALHVPNQLSIRYGAGWSEEETFAMQALLEGGTALGRAAKDSIESLSNNTSSISGVKEGAAQLGKSVGSIAANILLGKSAGLSAMTGLAPNPMKEQVFKGVDFRTFTMEYQFAPRSSTESKNVHDIINAFKYHMHPEYKDSNNFLFLYPSEFDISYFHGGVENEFIHRHTSCVLTELSVNYTPNGNFTTFANGAPTQINVAMTFKELTVLTKELIAQGL